MIRRKLSALPRHLYKYCNFRSEGHIKILTDHSFYFASPVSFNDVFEFVAPERDIPQMREKYSKLLYDLLHDRDFKPDTLSYLDKHDLFASLNLIGQSILSQYESPASGKDAVTHFYQQYIAVFTGVLCFSANYSNILMWSHYADEHSGFCIGFSTDYLLQLNADFIGKVSYSRERPLITTNDIDDEEKLINIAFTKAIDWANEDEYRIVSTRIDNRIVRFDRNAVRTIYLGCRCKNWRDTILRIRDKALPHVIIYQAKISDDEFGLIFEVL